MAGHLNLGGIEILVSVNCIKISILLKLSSGMLCLGQTMAEWLKPVVQQGPSKYQLCNCKNNL